MKAQDIIIAGIAGTTAFTIFSYVVSKSTSKNFKEPALIGEMIHYSDATMDKNVSEFTGWILHYLIGISFAAAYKQMINTTRIKPSIRNGIVTGALSGFPAALAWHTALAVHADPPRKKSFDYYVQLFFGHIIFGAVSFFVFDVSNKKRDAAKSTAPLNSLETKLGKYATAGS